MKVLKNLSVEKRPRFWLEKVFYLLKISKKSQGEPLGKFEIF